RRRCAPRPVTMAAAGAPAPSADERVGAVVLTYNRAVEVTRTVDRLANLPERPRIVVVDNASVDQAASALARQFPDVSYVRLDQNYGASARNVGVRLCARPYVGLCDDDTWFEPGSLSRAADLFDTYPSVAIVTGKVLVGGS